jgi:hypothetical protein
MFATMMLAAVVSWLVINLIAGILELSFGREAAVPEPMSLLVSAVIYVLIFGCLFLVAVRRHPAWVVVSGRGLELAGTGRDPVFLPWSAIDAVDRRFRGPFTDLVVTPRDMSAVQITRRGWTRPRTIVRHGRSAFVVDAGLMQPGPEAVLAEIHRRRAAEK